MTTGFEPGSSGIGIDRAVNSATITAQTKYSLARGGGGQLARHMV